LTFYPPKKVAPPLIRVEKKISSKLHIQGIKRSRILPWFQKCAEVSSLAKGEKIWQKKLNFSGLYEKKSLGTCWLKGSAHFLNQHKIPFLLIPFAPNFEEIFSTLIRAGSVFLEVKSSNKIEIVQYFKKRYGFKAKPKSHEAKWSRKITGP
jgi:hypothetical protein